MVYQFRLYYGGVVLSLESIIKASLISNKQPIQQHIQNNLSTIYTLIDNEFQKDFIKKLYPNPLWTNRVYWNVIGRIQDEHEDIQLDNIIKCVDQYLEDNNMCISQRDLLKFIRDSIITHRIEGKTKKEDVSVHATENGVSIDRFNEAIKRMKAEGSVFEIPGGFYRCI